MKKVECEALNMLNDEEMEKLRLENASIAQTALDEEVQEEPGETPEKKEGESEESGSDYKVTTLAEDMIKKKQDEPSLWKKALVAKNNQTISGEYETIT